MLFMSLLKPHKSFLSHMHIVYMRTIISFKNRQICNELLTKNSVQSHENKFQRISRATCITCKLTLVTSIFFTCFGLTFICPASLLSEYLFKKILIDIFSSSDINECEGKHGCSSKAKCVNTIGSYGCQCLPGYRGDGFNCQGKQLPIQNTSHLPYIITFSHT